MVPPGRIHAIVVPAVTGELISFGAVDYETGGEDDAGESVTLESPRETFFTGRLIIAVVPSPGDESNDSSPP